MTVQDLATYGTDDLRIAFRGTIIDEPYFAASTNDNGGCALHACFGIPSATGLFRSDVREQVLQELPTEYSAAVARLNAAMRHSLDTEVLNNSSVWEAVRGGARCRLHHKDFEYSEQRIAWNAVAELPEVDVDVILGFVQTQEYESQNSEAVKRRLRGFYASLFRAEHEDVVKELCVLLNYLQANPDEDLHSSHTVNGEVQARCGGLFLDLLKPCVEDPEVTKYGAMFLPAAEFDRYRQAFFDPSGASPEHRATILNTLSTMAERYAETPTVAPLLRQGCDLLEQRYTLYGHLETPASWTNTLAWKIFRAALGDSDYWLTCTDLKVVLAFWQCSLEVYDAVETSSGAYSFYEVLSSTQELGHAQRHVRVVLQRSQRSEPGSVRGHFSRLFSAAEWQQREAVGERNSDRAEARHDHTTSQLAPPEEGEEEDAEAEDCYTTDASSSIASETESTSSETSDEDNRAG